MTRLMHLTLIWMAWSSALKTVKQEGLFLAQPAPLDCHLDYTHAHIHPVLVRGSTGGRSLDSATPPPRSLDGTRSAQIVLSVHPYLSPVLESHKKSWVENVFFRLPRVISRGNGQTEERDRLDEGGGSRAREREAVVVHECQETLVVTTSNAPFRMVVLQQESSAS